MCRWPGQERQRHGLGRPRRRRSRGRSVPAPPARHAGASGQDDEEEKPRSVRRNKIQSSERTLVLVTPLQHRCLGLRAHHDDPRCLLQHRERLEDGVLLAHDRVDDRQFVLGGCPEGLHRVLEPARDGGWRRCGRRTAAAARPRGPPGRSLSGRGPGRPGLPKTVVSPRDRSRSKVTLRTVDCSAMPRVSSRRTHGRLLPP